MIDAGNDLKSAQAAIAPLEATVNASHAEVSRLREDYALGRRTRGDLQGSIRRLQREIEALEQAKARVRAFARLEAEAGAAAETARRAAASAAAEVSREERAELLAAVVAFFDQTGWQYDALDQRIKAYNAKGGSRIPRPSDLREFQLFSSAAARLRRLYGDLA